MIAADALFKMKWITAILQHVFIIIGFEKYRMALFEMMHHMLAGAANIGDHACGNTGMADYKTMRIASIMFF